MSHKLRAIATICFLFSFLFSASFIVSAAGPNYMGFNTPQHVTIGTTFYTDVWADINTEIDAVAMDNFTFLPAGIIHYQNASRGNIFPDYVMWIKPLYIHNDAGWAQAIMWAYDTPANNTNATAFNITWSAQNVGKATITITEGGTARGGFDPGTTKYTGEIYVHPEGINTFDATATLPNSIYLSWAKGLAMDRTVIRGSKIGYPSTPTDGTAVYNNTGTSTTHAVSPLETWYYSAWGWNASEGYFSITYETDDATTPTSNNPPNAPITPFPLNNTAYMNVYNIYLNCIVSDPDGGVLDVHFYWGNNTLIGTIVGVANNTVASLYLPGHWSRKILGYDCYWVTHDTTHTWYAVADDSEYQTQGPTWNFHTNKAWDLDANKRVNVLDLSALVSHYALRVYPPGASSWDINEDTYTNVLDVSGLVSHYGQIY